MRRGDRGRRSKTICRYMLTAHSPPPRRRSIARLRSPLTTLAACSPVCRSSRALVASYNIKGGRCRCRVSVNLIPCAREIDNLVTAMCVAITSDDLSRRRRRCSWGATSGFDWQPRPPHRAALLCASVLSGAPERSGRG